jgi:hypothetical protein
MIIPPSDFAELKQLHGGSSTAAKGAEWDPSSEKLRLKHSTIKKERETFRAALVNIFMYIFQIKLISVLMILNRSDKAPNDVNTASTVLNRELGRDTTAQEKDIVVTSII